MADDLLSHVYGGFIFVGVDSSKKHFEIASSEFYALVAEKGFEVAFDNMPFTRCIESVEERGGGEEIFLCEHFFDDFKFSFDFSTAYEEVN